MDTAEIINKMVDDIIDGNNTEAKDQFSTIISTKLTAALDSRKQELAKSTYAQAENGTEE